MIDPHISYIDMTNMYIYFFILLLVLFINPSFNDKKTFIVLAIVLIVYPFLFILSRYENTFNPVTKNFPYLEAILAAKENSWFYVLSHPWHTFETTHPHNGAVLEIENIMISKLPGFAVTAKILSYFVFGKWTYVVCVVGLNIFASFLLVKALMPESNERRWYIIGMLCTTTFLIQPYGAEQICAAYLAISVFFLHKFKQSGNPYSLLASVVSGAFLFLDLSASIFIFPFLIVYAFLDNRHIGKMLIYSVIYSLVIVFLLSKYFDLTSDISSFKYYLHKAAIDVKSISQKDWMWRLKSSFLIICITYGSLFFMSILAVLFRPIFKTSMLILAGIIPTIYSACLHIPSEVYRQLHLNCVISFVVFFRYLSSLDAKYYDRVKRLCLKIVVGYSMLHAIMIHKFYLIPEVVLSPLADQDTPPLPWGWPLGLKESQKVAPIVFAATFGIWLLILISKDRIRSEVGPRS